ncbi:hypothetical protein B0O41_0469 [Propionibacteriaceae bacterium ES.041]|uniref:Uncharacterized protein n=1 Tax=Enemella evansiae TaxID=2016499 RepID=A0A255GMU1_9ACTN|nr:hypothetical protein [Enemella evansiae]PFG65699.1 hypothetical protein B0O41_0469 [Propionibacteriaceae bacterium ES.041]OYN98604.1 hypothetical protein CGZ96_09260 [Enemella evansiae]OYO02196.1 hypothetical protein CGZ95_06690 [Enemella evansiae]OYO10876.1 hypothetical protein CGZ98_09510 [Enemella evansiae]OYO16712.1 hypothetical protein CGZ94_03495 [Enemella evansiae]
MRVADAEYVLVTSYASRDEPDEQLHQIVQLAENTIGFWVNDLSKVADLETAPVVSLRASDKRGRPDLGEPVWEGRAQVLTDGERFDEVRRLVEQKYSLGSGLDELMSRAKGLLGRTPTEAVVVITILS